VLGIDFYAPLDAEPAPLVTIAFSNTVIDRFRAEESHFRKVYEDQVAAVFVPQR